MFNPENKIIVDSNGNAEVVPLTDEEKEKLVKLKTKAKKKKVLTLGKDQTIVVDETGNAEVEGSGKNVLKPKS